MKKILLVALVSAVVIGCKPSQSSDIKHEDVQLTETTNMTSLYEWDARGLSEVIVPNANVQLNLNGTSIDISGNLENPISAGKTNGAHIKIVDDQALSEKTAIIKILGRAINNAELYVAYSTSDSGNSGWKRVDLKETNSISTIEYDVPALVKGRGDYVGFYTKNGTVSIKSIKIGYRE